jgi:hypothetical protein
MSLLEDVIVFLGSIKLMVNAFQNVQVSTNNGMEMLAYASLDMEFSTKYAQYVQTMLLLILQEQAVFVLLLTISSTH